jgi:CubicO group peptidase (beta-lactamase class C family)
MGNQVMRRIYRCRWQSLAVLASAALLAMASADARAPNDAPARAAAGAAGGTSTVYFPAPGRAWQRRSPESQGIDPQRLAGALAQARAIQSNIGHDLLQVMSEKNMKREGTPGIVGEMRPRGDFNGLLLRHGYIVAEFGDTERVDMTFSASKTFLSLVAGLTVDRGLIEDLRDPVGQYVKGELFASAQNSKVTWQQLLQMTSEWQGTIWGKPDTIEQPKGHVRQAPGTVWIHNDPRINVLALSLLEVWRKPLPDVLRQGLMDPIGASNTWEWHGYRNSDVQIDGRTINSVSGGGHWGGGMFISSRDLARVGYLLLRQGAWGNRQVLSQSYVREMLTPCAVEPTFGYLIWVNPDGKLWPSAPHSSFALRGFGNNIVWVDPDHDLVLVLRWVDWEKLDQALGAVVAAVKTP